MSKTINVNKASEGVDYEMIPVDYVDNDAAWDVRILRGDFVETVIRYGTIKFDGTRDCLTFNFRVVQSPVPFLEPSNVELQECAADILEDIIERGCHDGWIYTKERLNKDDDGNTIGTNDSTESIDE
jgi:hypothetical protein